MVYPIYKTAYEIYEDFQQFENLDVVNNGSEWDLV